MEIHPEDAAKVKILDGDEVDIISRRGSVRGTVSIKDILLPGTVYMNFHYGETITGKKNTLVNLVCNHVYDTLSKQPIYKYCAVKIEKH